jgi:hypothetical protein
VRTLDAHLYELNAANPAERAILIEEQGRLELKLAHAQRLCESESFNLGYRAAQRTRDRRDLLDTQLSELHGLLHEHDFSNIERCRTPRCPNVAGPPFTHMGRCPDCLTHAQNGTTPSIDPTAPPEPYIGSVFGS